MPTCRFIQVIKTDEEEQEDISSSPTTVAAGQPSYPNTSDFLYQQDHRDRQLEKNSASYNCTITFTPNTPFTEARSKQHQQLPFFSCDFSASSSAAPPADNNNTPTTHRPPAAAHQYPASYGGDIKTLEKTHAWQPPSYPTSDRSTLRIAPVTTNCTTSTAVPPSMVAMRRVSESSQEHTQFNSYFPNNTGASRRDDHAPSSRDSITMERPCRSFPVFPKECWGNISPPPHPSNISVAASSTTTSVLGGSLSDLKSSLSNISIAAQSFLVANKLNAASSSLIPCDDKIFGKQPTQQHIQQYPQQQRVCSRFADSPVSNEDNAFLDNLTCPAAPNVQRKSVTGFTYAVMCQFVKAKFIENDRKGNRHKIDKNGVRTNTPIGHVGLKCKYCAGKGGSRGTGRYFPFSFKTFSDTTKTVMPMHRHLILCFKCPDDIKSLISRLHDHHAAESKILKTLRRRESQMSFYRQIWRSLHPDDVSSSKKKKHRPKSLRGEEKKAKASSPVAEPLVVVSSQIS